MPLFRYSAVDEHGNAVTGTMEEVSARRVAAILHEQGFQVGNVEEVRPVTAFPRLKARLTWGDVQLLNDHLLAIMRSGLPLAPALESIAFHMQRPKLRNLLDDIRGKLENGQTLDEAFHAHAGAFPPVYLAAIRAGERSGNLQAVLEHFASHAAHMVELKSRTQEMLAYPITVAIVSALTLFILLTRVLPEFEEFSTSFGTQLPAFTRLWIDAGRFFQSRYLETFIGIAICAVAIRFMLQRPTIRYRLDWLKLRTFGIGNVVRTGTMARFTRTLAVLLAGKATLPDSLRLAAAAAGNSVIEQAALRALDSVEAGNPLAPSFRSAGEFSNMFCWLVGVAENRGDLGDAMRELAVSYEQSFQQRGRMLIGIVSPLIIVLLAVLIVGIIVATYLPIFSLADAVFG
jgi:type II secretory pathway component PulF